MVLRQEGEGRSRTEAQSCHRRSVEEVLRQEGNGQGAMTAITWNREPIEVLGERRLSSETVGSLSALGEMAYCGGRRPWMSSADRAAYLRSALWAGLRPVGGREGRASSCWSSTPGCWRRPISTRGQGPHRTLAGLALAVAPRSTLAGPQAAPPGRIGHRSGQRLGPGVPGRAGNSWSSIPGPVPPISAREASKGLSVARRPRPGRCSNSSPAGP